MPAENMPTGSESDPIANTQMFRRFAAEPEPAASGRRRYFPLLVVLAVVLAAVLAAVLVWLS